MCKHTKKFFMTEGKKRGLLAFIPYSLIVIEAIGTFLGISIPWPLRIVISIIMIVTFSLGLIMDLEAYWNKEETEDERPTRKITNELLKFIPVWVISVLIGSILTILFGEPTNQIRIEEEFEGLSLFSLIAMVIYTPIIEEYLFRFLPHKFIKNQVLYIIISSIVFAGMHVVDDPNAFCHIWIYIIRPIYYAYRYYKTQDIRVTISFHAFNNLISTLMMLI